MILLILIAITISLIFTSLISLKFKNSYVKNNYIIINTILAYVFILIFTWLYDLHLESVLQSYDINNDGIFDKNEQSKEQEAALSKVINDTARSLIPFTGVFYAITYGFLLLSCKKLLH